MTQQNWPFENAITGLCSRDEILDPGDNEDVDDRADVAPMLYIVEGTQLGYGTSKAWEVAQ